MRIAICYVSTAAPNLSKKEIGDLLRTTEEKNNRRDFTGIFLFSQGNFFQILEGEKEQVEALFSKIKEDPRHYDVLIIFQKETGDGKFDRYTSSFTSEDARITNKDMESYQSLVESLDPSVRPSARYILQKFTEGGL